MSAMPDLVLRDIHTSPPPGWWPPAPGWWWLGTAVVCMIVMCLGWRLLRTWRRRRWMRRFDAEVDAASGATAKIATMSALLRRAARRRVPAADRLSGEAWLAFLDTGQPDLPFTAGVGRALHDGAFRRDAGTLDLRALHAAARLRFVALMTESR